MDWQAIGVRLAPVLTLLLGLGAASSIFGVFRVRRTARATSFGFVRERSIVRGKRLLVLTIVLLILFGMSGGLWAVSVRKPELLPPPVPTATPSQIPSPTPRTPTATFAPTHTPTVTPIPTETPVPPDADLPSALRTPFPAHAVTPGPGAVLAELVLAAGEQDDRPVDPGTHFAKGTERVYAFFVFDGMSRNVPWVHVWYRQVDGQMIELWSQAELWTYDAALGRAWRYCSCRPGRYELHIYVGRRLQQQVPFTVGIE